MSACYCDYDETFKVYERQTHVARKEHKCSECSRMIQPKERYEHAFGILSAGAYVYKTCSLCLDLREFVVAHVPCSCWTHRNMREDVMNDAQGWAHEAPGLLFGAYRREIRIRRARKAALA
jgi:hypothetical protein